MLYKAEDEKFGKRYIEFGKTEKKSIGVYVLPKILDEQVALLHLDHVNAKLSKLSEEQADYLGLDAKGPFKSDMYVFQFSCLHSCQIVRVADCRCVVTDIRDLWQYY